MRLISSGQWDNLKPADGVDTITLRIFNYVRCELTSVDGNRIVMPGVLPKCVVELAHKGHQGFVKTLRLLRSKVWFPRMDSVEDAFVKKCSPSQVATFKTSREPLNMTTLPSGP